MNPEEGIEDSTEITEPTGAILEILQTMCNDERNAVCVISGRNKDQMEKEFGHIKNLYIAAENGYYYGWNDMKKPLEFKRLIDVADWRWKSVVNNIIKSYKERTDGSLIEDEETRVRWYFKDVEAEFARKEANELVAHLKTMLGNLQLEIMHHKDYVEIKPIGIDKGSFAKKLLHFIEGTKGTVDLILCIGDNETDERAFKEVKRYAKARRQREFCITVGQKVSLADYYLNDQSEVTTLLSEILMTTIKVMKF